MKTYTNYESIQSGTRPIMGTKTLVSFLTLTFGLSWVPMSLFILFADQLTPLFGEMSSTNPIFLLCVYAPGLSGIFLIWRHYGLKGLGSFFRRLMFWRAPVQWWLFLLLGIPAIVYAAAAINGTITEPFRFLPWYMVFPALAQSLLLGPMGEEFGWRGLALPLLQRRFSPFWASLILGVVWAIWHAPAFLMSGTPQSAWSFGPFFIGLVAITIILTPLFNASHGSLLIAILYHLQIMNPIFPDAQPWDNFLFIIVAVIIVWVNRRNMFKRGTGISEVLMPVKREDLPGLMFSQMILHEKRPVYQRNFLRRKNMKKTINNPVLTACVFTLLLVSIILTACAPSTPVSDPLAPTAEVFIPLDPSPTPSYSDLPINCQFPNLKVYMDKAAGYCFAYPMNFMLNDQPSDKPLLQGPAVDTNGEVYANLKIEVTTFDPTKTLTQQVDEFMAEFTVIDPAFFEYNTINVAGESAILVEKARVDNNPVQMNWRIVFVPHAGSLYRLIFRPMDVTEVKADIDTLYQTTTGSFTFLYQEPLSNPISYEITAVPTTLPTTIPLTPTAITHCDWVSFISDVSVPDGSKYAPGSTFVKTWRLKNIGTCTWTTSYSLVFVNGDQMGGATVIALPGNVAPNQTVDVSVTLTAPAAEKAYTGNWMLRNASGVVFGIGPTASSAFWVKITVAEPAITAIVYDFVANYNLATWECAAGPTVCTIGSTSDPLGFVMKLNSPQLENNTTGTDPALLTHPQNVNDGYITGTYPAFDVKSGDRFQAKLGCQYASTVCFLRFRLDYQVGADPVKNLGQWDEKYDGQYTTVNVDLSSLAGKSVVFFLKAQALGSPVQDDGLWSAARITRTNSISTTGSCALVSQTPANNTSFAANYDFDTVWTVKNTGTYDWNKSVVDFVYVNGTKMHKPAYGDLRDLPLDVVKNGNIALIVDMLAPATSGTYSETWALVDGSNTICTMFVTIKVKP